MKTAIVRYSAVRLLSAIAMAALASGAAIAQVETTPPAVTTAGNGEASADEIIVTARKRNETTLDVPISLVALGRADLDRYNTRDLTTLSAQVPGLIIAQATGGAGGSIALRGVSSSGANPSIDQAISFNIDGVQVSSANLVRLGQIDLQQLEIFKGPQALFFGKNSPGGIISLRTADPGDKFQGSAILSREFNARENSIELAFGGPVTDKLGVRVVAYGNKMQGYRFNESPTIPNIAFGPEHRRDPHREEVFLRGTVVYKPNDDLTIRGKYNYSHLTGANPWTTAERIACPYGLPQVGGLGPTVQVDDCRADGHFVQGDQNPNLVAPFKSIVPFQGTESRQQLGSLEINYTLAPAITFTSVSGYYKLAEKTYGQSGYGPVSLLISGTDVDRRELSQEVRLTTGREEWPVNFTIGAYYQDTNFANATPLIFDRFALGQATTPGQPLLSSYTQNFVNTEAYSFFGQAIWKIFPNLELAGGARYSVEKKRLAVNRNPGFGGGPFVFGTINGERIDRERFTDTSPEATLTWRPTRQLSIFGAFRNGFKSGGFNTSGVTAISVPDPRYRPEDVRGYEGGVKADFGDIRLNLTGYTYLYKNLQVSTYDPSTAQQLVINAATARIKGIEGDFNWRVRQIEGLNLRGSLSYNDARYKSFLVGCYTGQTIAMRCNIDPNPATGAFRQQNFAGKRLTLAPELTGTGGFSFEWPLADSIDFMLTGDTYYKSRYYADLEAQPFGSQRRSWTFDASVRIKDTDDKWELALIGQNLTEVYRSNLTAQVPLTGIGSRTGTNIPGGLSDLNGQINRGRQVRLQLTVRTK